MVDRSNAEASTSMAREVTERREDAYGLEQVLSNTEFETSQQEQAIQTERERIQAYEKEIEEKQREIGEFEKATTDLEDRQAKAQRQLQQNRDNIESLKHTSTVLDEHLEALKKSYLSTVQETQRKCVEYDGAIEKYTERWERYQSTYKRMPRAQELSFKMETLKQVKEEGAVLDAEIMKARQALKIEGQDPVVECVLQVATIRVETATILRLLNSTREAVTRARAELAEAKCKVAVGKVEEETTEPEHSEMSALPSPTLTPVLMDTSTAEPPAPSPPASQTPPATTHAHTLAESSSNEGDNSSRSSFSHDSRVLERNQHRLPPESTAQQPMPTPLQASQPPVSIPKELLQQPTQPRMLTSAQGGKPPATVFAVPQIPQRHFTMPKSYATRPQKFTTSTTTALSKASNTAKGSVVSPATTQPVTASSSSSSDVGSTSRPSTIPPVFQSQVPKPPVPTPKSTTLSSSDGKSKFSFELPKFSVPRSYMYSQTQTPASKPPASQAVLPQLSKTREPQATGHDQVRKSQSFDQGKSTHQKSSITESRSTMMTATMRQLYQPPKPVASQLPRFTIPKTSYLPPPKTFSLPQLPSLSSTRPPVQQQQMKQQRKEQQQQIKQQQQQQQQMKQQQQQQQQMKQQQQQQQQMKQQQQQQQQMKQQQQQQQQMKQQQQKQPRAHTSSVVANVPHHASSSSVPPTGSWNEYPDSSAGSPDPSQPVQSPPLPLQENQHQQPQTNQQQVRTSTIPTQEYQQQYHHQQYEPMYTQDDQQQQWKMSQETQMEVSKCGHPLLVEAGGEGGGVMDQSFDPASLSLDLGDQSVDFDKTNSPMFSFFTSNNQDTATIDGGVFNFNDMMTSTTEDSSTPDLQDFFSEFGKASSTNNDGTGNSLF